MYMYEATKLHGQCTVMWKTKISVKNLRFWNILKKRPLGERKSEKSHRQYVDAAKNVSSKEKYTGNNEELFNATN